MYCMYVMLCLLRPLGDAPEWTFSPPSGSNAWPSIEQGIEAGCYQGHFRRRRFHPLPLFYDNYSTPFPAAPPTPVSGNGRHAPHGNKNRPPPCYANNTCTEKGGLRGTENIEGTYCQCKQKHKQKRRKSHDIRNK